MIKSLFFRKHNILHKVKIDNISYIQANGDYSLAVGDDFKYVSSTKITEFVELLCSDSFVQVHRSYLVNAEKIDSVDLITYKILIGEQEIPLSKSRKTDLLDVIRIVK